MESMETTSMCRICLAVDVCMYSLVTTHLQEVFEDLSGAPLETEDKRPTQACYICISRLKNCYQLRQSCVLSEQLLTEILNGNMLGVQESCGRQRLGTEHPVVQLSVGGVSPMPSPACYPDKVKIERRESNDDAATEQDGTELGYSVMGLNSEFGISVDIVKVEPGTLCAPNVSGTYANVSETCQQFVQKNYRATYNNVKKSDVQYKTRESKPVIRKLNKTTQRTRGDQKTCTKQEKYIENMNTLNHSYAHSRDQSNDNPRIKPKPYTCDVCQKSFSTKATLKIHIHTHTGERPYQCRVCQKCFVQNNDLIKHMRKHTGEKPYQCNVCKKCFGQKHTLIGHFRTHTGEKPYICGLCNKSFADNSTFKGHVFTHSGMKPYQCHVCQKTYSRRHHLNRHKCCVRHIPK